MISALTCSGVTQVVDSNLVPTFASLRQYMVLPSRTRGEYPRTCAALAVAAAAASGDVATAVAAGAGLAPGALAGGAFNDGTAGVANVGALEEGTGWASVLEAGTFAPASRPVITTAVVSIMATLLTCLWHP